MKRIWLFVLGLFVVLTFAGLGCGDESGGGGGASAAEKIDKAWTKMSDTKAVHEEFDVQIEVDGDLSSLGSDYKDLLPASMGVKGSADLDQTDPENIKADIALELDVADVLDKLMQTSLGDTMGSDAALGMNMIGSMLENINIRMVDQMLYMELMGSWYEMDISDASSSSPVDLGSASSADTQCIQDKLVPSRMLKDIADKGKEKIDETDTTHITASLDSGAAVDLLAEVSKDCSDSEMTDSDITQAKDMLEQMVTKADIEVWIDGDDNIRKVSVNMEMDMSAIADLAGSEMDPQSAEVLNGMTAKVTMTLQMSKFGEEVSVEAPKDALPLEDLLGAFGGLGGGTDLGLGDGTNPDDFNFGDEGTSTGSSTTDRSSTNPSSY